MHLALRRSRVCAALLLGGLSRRRVVLHGFGEFTLSALRFDGFDCTRVGCVVGEEARAMLIRIGFIDCEPRTDFVLKTELPRLRLLRVIRPEASVRDGEARVGLALLFGAERK